MQFLCGQIASEAILCNSKILQYLLRKNKLAEKSLLFSNKYNTNIKSSLSKIYSFETLQIIGEYSI